MGGKDTQHKLIARAASEDSLLGEMREELFIVNLHINHSFHPLKISLLHAENTVCWDPKWTVGKSCIYEPAQDKSSVCVIVSPLESANYCIVYFMGD